MDELNKIFSLIQESRKAGGTPDYIAKAAGIETALGLLNYDLQRPALALYPFLASQRPLANSLPRVKGNGGTSTNWKAITGINTTAMPMGISEGNRGGVITQTLAEYVRSYRGIGLENAATFEAEYGSEGYDNAYAMAVQNLLRSAMLGEEPVLLFGNSSVELGTTPTPTGTGATTGGALSDGTYLVGCVALTPFGWQRATVTAQGVVQTFVRVNADSSTDSIPGGSAAPSANSSGVVLSAGTAVQRVSANVTAVRGAVAYAWYLGTGSSATMYLQQITKINSVNFNTALVTSTQTFGSLAATDRSYLGVYSMDGLLFQNAFKSTSNAYYTALATGVDGTGTKLTSDGGAGITQIETALDAFYTSWLSVPDQIWAAAGHVVDMTNIIIANGGAPLFRLNVDGSAQSSVITGGQMVIGRYLDKRTGKILTVNIHPSLPEGVIMFRTVQSPFPTAGVGNVQEVRYRQDWYQIEWPLRSRKREYGIYADEVVIDYMPFMSGAIVNVARGT